MGSIILKHLDRNAPGWHDWNQVGPFDMFMFKIDLIKEFMEERNQRMYDDWCFYTFESSGKSIICIKDEKIAVEFKLKVIL